MQQQIMQLVQSGQIDQAIKLVDDLLSKDSTNGELWFMMGALHAQMSRFDESERCLREASRINPSVPAVYYNLAIAQRAQGKHDEAVSALQRALELQTDFIPAMFELANCYTDAGDTSKSRPMYEQILQREPTAFQVLNRLAMIEAGDGAFDEALSHCRRSLEINAQAIETYLVRADIQERAGDIAAALDDYQKVEALGHRTRDTLLNIGRLKHMTGDTVSAEACYRKVLDEDQSDTIANIAMARIAGDRQQTDEATRFLSRVDLDQIEQADLLFNAAKVLADSRDFSHAVSTYRRSIEIDPTFIDAYVNLGNLYLFNGDIDDAYELYRSAYEQDRFDPRVSSNMLLAMNYSYDFATDDIIGTHREWGETISSAFEPMSPRTYEHERVRIGLVSPDYKRHSVAYFLQALFDEVDRERFDLYAYSDVGKRDNYTDKFEESATVWCDATSLDDQELASRIRDDEIDVLIDLCGHCAGNRLQMFAYKPAPVQITYLGYPNTTGLDRVDYRIIDDNSDPQSIRHEMVEEPLVIKDCFLCYTPPETAPPVVESPCVRNGYITFGSFNNIAKLTDDVIELWSRVISAVPDSHLLIKGRQFADDQFRRQIEEKFIAHGVTADRLELIAYEATMESHLELYGRIDIGLDTFPFNGVTTTLEAFWMGVPVIVLEGSRHAARVCVTILRNAGLEQNIAPDEDSFIAIAERLAADCEALARQRRGMREHLLTTTLFDRPGFARRFEKLIDGIG